MTTSENSVELDLSLDKITVSDDLQNVPVITFSRASLDEDPPSSLDEDPPASSMDPPANLDEDPPASSMDPPPSNDVGCPTCESLPSDEGPKDDDGETTAHNTSVNGELSIATLRGDNEDPTASSIDPPVSVEDPPPSNDLGCPSCESLLSDEPVFLHVHVSPKPGTTYTYTPINSAVGIDIPKGDGPRSKRSPSVQQVKTCFCFAFTEKRCECLTASITICLLLTAQSCVCYCIQVGEVF